MTGMPEALRREIAAIGAQFNDEINGRVRTMYAPLVPPPAPEIATALDLAYGEHPRQRLDAYYKNGGHGRRVLLYVPGGGFVAGDKRGDDKFYGNIARWFAGQDVVVFTMNYRLAPEAVWPAGGLDVRDAVAYVRAHAAEYGGDPQKITIFGQSAGAAHVAAFLFHPEAQDEKLAVESRKSTGTSPTPAAISAPVAARSKVISLRNFQSLLHHDAAARPGIRARPTARRLSIFFISGPQFSGSS